MKRTLLIFASAALLLSGPALAAGSGFSDVPEGHWAERSIRGCEQYGLMRGIGGGRFGLGMEMSRASYLTALCRVMEWELISPEAGSFRDNQKTGKWYYAAVETAYAHGALTRQSELCRPSDPITREEMAAMSVRALGYTMLAGTVGGQEECPFRDTASNEGYITLAARMEIVYGVDHYNFEPKRVATREEAAAVLLRMFLRLHDGFSLQYVSEAPQGAAMAESFTGTAGEIPLSPRAPLEALYALSEDGKVQSAAINAVPWAQNVRYGEVSEGRELSGEEFEDCFSRGKLYRSARFESSYLVCPEPDGSHTVVWFESESDILAKAKLCRCLGIRELYVVKG